MCLVLLGDFCYVALGAHILSVPQQKSIRKVDAYAADYAGDKVVVIAPLADIPDCRMPSRFAGYQAATLSTLEVSRLRGRDGGFRDR